MLFSIRIPETTSLLYVYRPQRRASARLYSQANRFVPKVGIFEHKNPRGQTWLIKVKQTSSTSYHQLERLWSLSLLPLPSFLPSTRLAATIAIDLRRFAGHSSRHPSTRLLHPGLCYSPWRRMQIGIGASPGQDPTKVATANESRLWTGKHT